MPQVLVVGLLEQDSGKTVVATAIAKELKGRGFDVGVSKPIAGHSAWYQFSTVEESRRKRMLIGEDALKLYEAAQVEDPLELVSPVDVLTAPPDPELLRWRTELYHSLIGNITSVGVLARVSKLHKGVAETVHMVVEESLERVSAPLRREIEELVDLLEPRPVKITSKQLEELLALEAERIADAAVAELSKKHEVLVIESFNDAAAPCSEALKSLAVVLVAPGRMAVYAGEKYAKACEALLGLKHALRTRDLAPLLKPIYTQPTPVKQRGDKLAEAVQKLVDLLEKKLEKRREG